MAIGPLSWPLLLQSVRRHFSLFFMLFFFLGVPFAAVGVGLLWFEGGDDWGAAFGGAFFALIGIGVMIMALVTSVSSIGYYYERALLREHGTNVDGSVLSVLQYNEPEDGEETLWLLRFRYSCHGQPHEGEAVLPDGEWVGRLAEGGWVPLRALKPRPRYAEPRWRKWKNQLQREGRW